MFKTFFIYIVKLAMQNKHLKQKNNNNKPYLLKQLVYNFPFY